MGLFLKKVSTNYKHLTDNKTYIRFDTILTTYLILITFYSSLFTIFASYNHKNISISLFSELLSGF